MQDNSPYRAESTRKLAFQGAGLGIVAGLFLACGEVLLAPMLGAASLWPVKLTASIALGTGAVTGAYSLGTIVIVAAVVHLALAAAYGAMYGVFIRYRARETRTSFAREAGLGMLYGLMIWAFDFYVVARALFPWFVAASPLEQALLHAVGYGLPLGVLCGAATQGLGGPSMRMYSTVRRAEYASPRRRRVH
jgi:hypothetical protein